MVKIEGQLPDNGGLTALDIKMADLPAIFSLKAHALGARYKEKDAYDLYAMTRYYGRGVKEVVERLKPHAGDPALKKGFEISVRSSPATSMTGPLGWLTSWTSRTRETGHA